MGGRAGLRMFSARPSCYQGLGFESWFQRTYPVYGTCPVADACVHGVGPENAATASRGRRDTSAEPKGGDGDGRSALVDGQESKRPARSATSREGPLMVEDCNFSVYMSNVCDV